MVSGPFLLPIHTAPIGSFWNEWLAGALGLGAAAFGLLGSRQRLPLSSLLLIPAALLLVMLMQLAFGRLAFKQLGLLYAIYLIWAGLLTVLGRHLAETVGLARLADVLATAMAIGALAGAAIAFMQWLGLDHRVSWMFAMPGNHAWGNLGQINHHAQYSWLGIASAFYLRGRNHLSRSWLWVLVVPVSFAASLGGSRSVFLYLLVLLVLLAWMRHKDPEGSAAMLAWDAALLLPALVVLNLIGDWASPRVPDFLVWLGNQWPLLDIDSSRRLPGGVGLSAARLYELVSGPSIRLAILHSGWSAFAQHIWLGNGAGSFPNASFQAAAGRAGDDLLTASENAHNFVLNLLVEFGAPATLAVLGVMTAWAVGLFRRRWSLEQFWCAVVLGIGAVHALLEYPLWYSYFLGPTALLLGASDRGPAFVLAGRRVALYLGAVVAAGSVILANLRADYNAFEDVVYRSHAADPDRERAWRMSMDSLLKLHRESLLSPWALTLLNVLAEPNDRLAPERVELCLRGLRFTPARSLVIRCSIHLAIAGRNAEAREMARAALRAYPDEFDASLSELDAAAHGFPVVEPLRAWAASVR
jgi:hypothetical protein